MMNKELKALEKLTKIHSYDEFNECYKIIENGLKALEIIITKNINVEDFKIYKSYSIFNQMRSLNGYIGITKEEYDILKGVLL